MSQIRSRAVLIGLSTCSTAIALLLAGFGATVPPVAPAVAGGCQKPAIAGLVTLSTVDGKAQSRSFLVQVPAGYAPSRAYPVAFVFHGGGGDSKQAYSWGLQQAAGAAAAAIFVFPNGSPLKDGVGWDDRAEGADLPFFDNMLKSLAGAYCIDSQKIFVAGFSWGGDFVVALACARGDVIRAAEANSTDDEFKDAGNYLTYQGLPCVAHKRPAIRFEHAENGDSSYPPPYFATTSQLFRHLSGCSSASESVPSSTAGTKCVAYSACSSGGYAECVFDKRIGHALPPNWAEDTWKFFASFK